MGSREHRSRALVKQVLCELNEYLNDIMLKITAKIYAQCEK
jgi:hypothetical protein